MKKLLQALLVTVAMAGPASAGPSVAVAKQAVYGRHAAVTFRLRHSGPGDHLKLVPIDRDTRITEVRVRYPDGKVRILRPRTRVVPIQGAPTAIRVEVHN